MLIPEVRGISKESENDIKVLQVYRPKSTKDQQDASRGEVEGSRRKDAGDRSFCWGVAAFSDTTTGKLEFSMAYDLNGDGYVAFKSIGDSE